MEQRSGSQVTAARDRLDEALEAYRRELQRVIPITWQGDPLGVPERTFDQSALDDLNRLHKDMDDAEQRLYDAIRDFQS